jgi:hypothetical protein
MVGFVHAKLRGNANALRRTAEQCSTSIAAAAREIVARLHRGAHVAALPEAMPPDLVIVLPWMSWKRCR